MTAQERPDVLGERQFLVSMATKGPLVNHLRLPSWKHGQPLEMVRSFFSDLTDIALDTVVTPLIRPILDEILVDALGCEALGKRFLDGLQVRETQNIAERWKRGRRVDIRFRQKRFAAEAAALIILQKTSI